MVPNHWYAIHIQENVTVSQMLLELNAINVNKDFGILVPKLDVENVNVMTSDV